MVRIYVCRNLSDTDIYNIGGEDLSPVTITLIVIAVLLVGVIIALYFLGKKAQKQQAEQEAQIAATKQTYSMLIIDKKRMKLKDAGLPAVVLEQTPRLLRGRKLPIVKAKIGPQVMSLICDDKIFDMVPVKKEVKASVSGIYMVEVKGLRGGNAKAEAKPKSKFKQAVEKLQEKAGAKPIK
jgi:hypothetical protein